LVVLDDSARYADLIGYSMRKTKLFYLIFILDYLVLYFFHYIVLLRMKQRAVSLSELRRLICELRQTKKPIVIDGFCFIYCSIPLEQIHSFSLSILLSVITPYQ
jgi:hypothetical protein